MSGSTPVIHNHFVTVANRRVHYRQAGSGPVVIMLHASPNSAKVVEPVQQVFAADFSTIAVDLPGYGLSEPLDVDDLRTEDLADAIVALMDTLGIGQAALYGRHTGAGIAVEAANRHPHRVSMVLTDGFPVFEKPYSEERLDEYLGSIDPKWDGSHLVWLWFRCRDLYVFWPWDKRTAGARADTDVPHVDSIHRCALELLEAGNGFRKVYASAFRHAGLKMIDQLKVPACFGNRPGDSQYHTMSKYPATAWTQEFPRLKAEASIAERKVLHSHPAASTFVQGPSDFAARTSMPDLGYAATGGRQTLVRTRGMHLEGTPTLLLHDMPGSSALHVDLLAALGAEAPALAIDLLGCGESRAEDVSDISADRWGRQIREVMDDLGIEAVNVVAIGTSAVAAAAFATAYPAAAKSIVLQSPPILDDETRLRLRDRYAISAEPEWDGSHLLRVFHHLRDQELWWPWFERTRDNIRSNEPRIDPNRLTLRVRECVKQPKFYKPIWDEALSFDLLGALSNLTCDVTITAAIDDTFSPFAAASGKTVVELGADVGEQAGVMLRTLR